MGCGNTSPRQPFQDLLAELNPGAAEYVKTLVAAGHDAEAARQRSLRVGASEEEIRQVQPSCNEISFSPRVLGALGFLTVVYLLVHRDMHGAESSLWN